MTTDMEIKMTRIGDISADDGTDSYVLLERKDDNSLTPEEAETWLLPRVYRNTDTPGAYYCTSVRATPSPMSGGKVICIVEHRYNI